MRGSAGGRSRRSSTPIGISITRTGNAELRAAYPEAAVYASNAIEGALTGFLARSRAATERQLEAGQIPEAHRAEVLRTFQAMDHPDALRPTRVVTGSADMVIAGRRLRLNLAPYAATEGDVWIHDRAAGLIVAGDLVVAEVPFMDTACPEGWRRALDAIAATRFTTLVPGHGAPMTRPRSWPGAPPSTICSIAARPTGRAPYASPAGSATPPASSRRRAAR